VLTLTGGKYQEFHDLDSVVQIGTVLINVNQRVVVGFVQQHDTTQFQPGAGVSSRWMAVDPLASKHHMLTPYNFVSSNPINMIDPDGKDGIKIIDSESKTITIKAVYYVQTVRSNNAMHTAYSSKDVKNMNEGINKTLNSLEHTVSEGDYAGYKVQFDLEFREGGASYETRGKATDTYEGIPIANTFAKASDGEVSRFKTKVIDNGDGTQSRQAVGGLTQENKHILMNVNKDTKRNKIHEIFHTLFFDNDNASKGIGSYKTTDLPNQDDINRLINNQQLPVFHLEKKDKE
jgi:hypothetical protein